MTREDFLKLYERFLKDECSEEELRMLFAYEDGFELSKKPWNDPLMGEKEKVRWSILQMIAMKNPTKYNVLWKVGLGIFILLSIGFFVFFDQEKSTAPPPVISTVDDDLVDDVLPGSDKAILILADGSQIVLDSARNGLKIDQSSATVVYEDGQLVYEANNAEEVVYNAIAIPKGGQYKLKLSDGTMVWLNADTYFKYPTSFKGSERLVELKGEGFFKVRTDDQKPFVVNILGNRSRNTSVLVTGTSFNINAYENENNEAIALVDGEVIVESSLGKTALKEGQVVELSDRAKVSKANIESIVAWKENRFQFENESLGSILRQIERWYDVEVIYNGIEIPNERYYGIISRDVPLSQVVKMLELSSKTKFEIKNKQLLVK